MLRAENELALRTDYTTINTFTNSMETIMMKSEKISTPKDTKLINNKGQSLFYGVKTVTYEFEVLNDDLNVESGYHIETKSEEVGYDYREESKKYK